MQINSNDIHIWSHHLTLTKEQENKKMFLLSDDEKERAKRFHFAIHRQRFIAARSRLREILSFYLAIAPEDIVFAYTENNKPFLHIPRHAELQFNLSHSEDMAVYAFTLQYAVGIDIEKNQNSYDEAVAKRFFSRAENDELMQLPIDTRAFGFYQIWSRKEAIIKATSKGLSLPLSSFSVTLQDGAQTVMLSPNERWSLFPLAIHPQYHAAVATNQTVKTILYPTSSP
jgi:4'-phosphopantetheinyl transferase